MSVAQLAVSPLPEVRGRITYEVVDGSSYSHGTTRYLMTAKAHGYRRDDGAALNVKVPMSDRLPEMEEAAREMCREILGAYLRDHPDCIANADGGPRPVSCDQCRLCY